MRSRLLIVVSAVVVFATSCSMWSEKKHPGWRQASGGEQLERLLWESVRHQDWQSVETHLAPAFAGVVDGRTLDRDGTLAYLKGTDVKAFTLSDVHVTPNADTMTVTYLLTPQNGGKATRRMTVWQRQKSGWIAIAHSVSAVTTVQ